MSHNVADLYNRQSALRLLSYKHVIVIGCGGIGNWVALDLALSGCVEKLYLIDPDTIEVSNLNRTIFRLSDVGKYKVDALCDIIFSRRSEQSIYKYAGYMTSDYCDKMIDELFQGDNSFYHTDTCVVDCRDDVYDDCYKLNCKLYKVGYDGVSITVDGNPRLTHVFGQRGGSYTVTPSYIGSSQMAAMIVCNDMLYPAICSDPENANGSNMSYSSARSESARVYTDTVKSNSRNTESFPYLNKRVCYEYDELGRLNDCVTINSCVTIPFKYIDNPHRYVMPNKEFDNLPNSNYEEE